MTASTSGRPRTVHVEHCMGTVFSIDVRDEGSWDTAIADVVQWLHHVDEVFSTYRPESVLSRLQRGELWLPECGPEVAEVLALCEEVESTTGGAFSPRYDRRLDPTGLVKGWAVDRAARMLDAAGARNHAVNGGGDVQLTGEASPGAPWRIGIADPLVPGTLACVVTGRDVAVATSGTAERGAHVLDPRTGTPVAELASVSLVGPRLTLVDSYATAALVLGDSAQAWVEGLEGYDAFAVRPDGSRWQTSGWSARV